MKVVAISNYGDESLAEKLIAENLDEEAARALVDEKNRSVQEGSSYWHVTKSDDYILWRGMADLVGDTE